MNSLSENNEMTTPTTTTPESDASVSWTDFVRFVRQLSHDLRNHLNALELQSVFINEVATDPELKSEIRRLRDTIAEVTGGLQKLSTALTDPKPNKIPYAADDLMKDFETKFARLYPEHAKQVEWRTSGSETKIEIDPQLLEQAIFELLDNAFRFSPKQARFTLESSSAQGSWRLTLHEPKEEFNGSTASWGREPLSKVSHAHYSLGLNRVRAIIAAHDGEFQAEYDPVSRALTTTIVLPLAHAGR